MMFSRRKNQNKEELYHPKGLNTSSWLICHVVIGAKSVTDLGNPSAFNKALAPEWYQSLPEDRLEPIWDAQDLYTRKILKWIDGIGIVDAFISGADEHRERELIGDMEIPPEGHFVWSTTMADVIPELNVHNLYLKAKDGSEFIIYESDTETVFVRDAHDTLPKNLRIPQLDVPKT